MGISLAVFYIIFLSIILVPELPLVCIGGIVKLGIFMTLSHVLHILGIFNGFSAVCTIVLLIGVFILHLIPALPCHNLGFICAISFAFVIIGFMTCFSGCIFGSRLLCMP